MTENLWSANPTSARTGMWELTPGRSASIRQPHWHRHLDVKRPNRAVEELHHVAATRTERRLYVQVILPPTVGAKLLAMIQSVSPASRLLLWKAEPSTRFGIR